MWEQPLNNMIVQAIRKLGLPLRGALFTALVCAAVLSVNVTTSGRTRRHTLSEELKARTSSEGLALVSVQSNWVWVVPFGAALETIRNPRDLSRAWFSGDSSFVLWSLGSPSYGTSAECPSAFIVEAF